MAGQLCVMYLAALREKMKVRLSKAMAWPAIVCYDCQLYFCQVLKRSYDVQSDLRVQHFKLMIYRWLIQYTGLSWRDVVIEMLMYFINQYTKI